MLKEVRESKILSYKLIQKLLFHIELSQSKGINIKIMNFDLNLQLNKKNYQRVKF